VKAGYIIGGDGICVVRVIETLEAQADACASDLIALGEWGLFYS